MKRLLKISLDLSLLSFIPVMSWLCLGLIIDKNLINIFTLTYPLQFIYYILKSIFSRGANISKVKDSNKDAVIYITFMNMDISIYKTFTIYSIVQLLIQLIFAFVLDKLYFEEENTKADSVELFNNLALGYF